MAQKNIVLVPIVACSLLLVMGALNHQAPLQPTTVAAAFVRQPVAVTAGLDALTPGQILARAAAAVSSEATPWLLLKTWQKQVDDEVSFEADGRLVRGPNQCARLEMTVRSGTGPSAVVTVSDGVGLAHACRLPNRPATFVSQRFISPTKMPLAGDQIEQILNAHGCGGPHGMLKDLARTLDNLHSELGTWKEKPVIRLTGSVKTRDTSVREGRLAAEPRLCHVYLDAQTLWPYRVEWWASRKPEDAAFLFLQVEFRDPEVNRPLSHEDCVREFTYVPE